MTNANELDRPVEPSSLDESKESRAALTKRIVDILKSSGFQFKTPEHVPSLIFVADSSDESRPFVMRLIIGVEAVWSELEVFTAKEVPTIPDLYVTLNDMNKREMFGALYLDGESISFRDALLDANKASDEQILHLVKGAFYVAHESHRYLKTLLIAND